MVGLWLWGLSIWFFLVSVGSLWKYLRPESKGKLRFQMTWFSFVFPNTALVSSSLSLPAVLYTPCATVAFLYVGSGGGVKKGKTKGVALMRMVV